MHILEIVSSSWSRSVWYSVTSSANSVSLLLVLLEAGVLIVVTGAADNGCSIDWSISYYERLIGCLFQKGLYYNIFCFLVIGITVVVLWKEV